MKSIISQKQECYLCSSTCVLEEHHIFFGRSKRPLSEKYGLKVYLCWQHHRGINGVHGRHGHTLDKFLKQIAQNKFNEKYPDLDFMKIFKKNYL